MKVKHAIERLQRKKPDDEIAMSLWGTEDIIDHASGLGIDLSEEEAREVVFATHAQQDAEIGINWEVIETHIRFFAADRESDESVE